MNRLIKMIFGNFCKLFGAYCKLRPYGRHPEKYPEAESWALIKESLMRCVQSGNVELQVVGLDNIPQTPGFMLYANHQGLFDVVAIGSTCPAPLGVVYKKELAGIPVLKRIMQATRSFAMDRGDVRQSLQVIRAVTEEVERGRNYLIFPEGTRSKTGNTMNAFHGGSFRPAVKAKCPVVPVALIDSYRVLDQKGSKRVCVKLYYLAPISYEEYKDMKPAQLAELVKERIQSCIAEKT